MSNTLWCGSQYEKLFLQSGQFSSTIKASLDVSGIDNYVQGISWDGINTPWCGFDGKLYLQSGQFSSTLKTSIDLGGISDGLRGISWDGTNTPWVNYTTDKLYLQSGQFSSTIKTSLDIGDIDAEAHGISYDGTNTPWCGVEGRKLYLQSGQFSSTLKTSEDVSGTDFISDISWDGTDTPWCGYSADKLYLQSGQFTSTLKISLSVVGIDNKPLGIEHGDVNERIYPPDLQGTIDGVSNAAGLLNVNIELQGTIGCISNVTGALSLPQITLQSTTAGTSNVSGSLDAVHLILTGAAGVATVTPRFDFPNGTVAVWVEDVFIKNLTSGVEDSISLAVGEKLEYICDDWDSVTYLSISGDKVSGDISGWTLPNSLASFSLSSTSVSGDISGWTLPNSLAIFSVHTTSVSGDISGWTLPNSLVNFQVYSTSVSGDISGWVLPNLSEFFNVSSTSVSGDISGWSLPNPLKSFSIHTTFVSGDISGWILPSGLESFYVSSTSVSGDISGWTLPNLLKTFSVHTTFVSGDISGWTLPNSLVNFRVLSTFITYGSSAAFTGITDSLTKIDFDNCALAWQQVDDVLADCVASGITDGVSAKTLDVGDNNAAPTAQGGIDKATLEGRGWTVKVTAGISSIEFITDGVAATSTVVGSLDLQSGLTGITVGEPTVIGSLNVNTELGSSIIEISGELAVLGILAIEWVLIGTSTENSTVTSSLNVDTELGSSIAEIVGISATLSDLDVLTLLSVLTAGTANLFGSLSLRPGLQGAIIGAATTFGFLNVETKLQGIITGLLSSISAFELFSGTFDGNIDSLAIASGSLTFRIAGFYESLANQLSNYFEKNVAGLYNISTRYDNDPRKTPDGFYIEYILDFGTAEQFEIGVNSSRHVGNVNIKLKDSIGQGTSRLLDIADDIVLKYKNIELNNINFRVPRVVNVGRVEDNHQINVICPFFVDN